MSTSEGDFEQFSHFLDEWSRRDFLKRVSGTVAYAAFLAGGVELMEACGNSGGTSNTTTAQPKKGGVFRLEEHVNRGARVRHRSVDR